MSITDELRERAKSAKPISRKDLFAIADRIDDEALSERNAAYNEGYDSARESIIYDMRREHDEWVADRDTNYVKLPVDADGVPIRVGDKVDSDHYEDGTVTGVQFYEMANGGIRTLIAVRPDGWDVATWHTPDEYRHHHEPTVEDVLKDFIDAWAEWKDGAAMMNPVETYAAKLRLAGDGE